ncbi:MAG: TonB-dependent receptor plug domain-containing protein, partial [Muribaculaceae bacterium]|nr:TonB-dependent receptor plug domain-containing protein [Muribaculaceae bacterium]
MKKLFLLLTAVLMAVVCALAQGRTITGTVVYADDDEPLAGATVMPVGGGQGTATDLDGKFTLNLPANVTKVTVSYIGMVQQTLTPTDGMVVKLRNSENNLDEVMVVAYGTAKKSAYTGSASVIKADDIEGRMVTDAVSALAGTMAGVQVLTTDGQPGSSPSVRIRGIGSIQGSSTPLYVVDGMPFDGDIATLNTMDVESMTVLKDAAAAALYGARGANGVILITTKRGKEGDAKITFDARWGANSRQNNGYDVIKDPRMYAEMTYQAINNGYRYHNGMDVLSANLLTNADIMGTNGASVFGAGYNPFTIPAGQLMFGQDGKLNPNATLGALYN